jgi:hypothetical protein
MKIKILCLLFILGMGHCYAQIITTQKNGYTLLSTPRGSPPPQYAPPSPGCKAYKYTTPIFAQKVSFTLLLREYNDGKKAKDEPVSYRMFDEGNRTVFEIVPEWRDSLVLAFNFLDCTNLRYLRPHIGNRYKWKLFVEETVQTGKETPIMVIYEDDSEGKIETRLRNIAEDDIPINKETAVCVACHHAYIIKVIYKSQE